jgi:hypothetical protein
MIVPAGVADGESALRLVALKQPRYCSFVEKLAYSPMKVGLVCYVFNSLILFGPCLMPAAKSLCEQGFSAVVA